MLVVFALLLLWWWWWWDGGGSLYLNCTLGILYIAAAVVTSFILFNRLLFCLMQSNRFPNWLLYGGNISSVIDTMWIWSAANGWYPAKVSHIGPIRSHSSSLHHAITLYCHVIILPIHARNMPIYWKTMYYYRRINIVSKPNQTYRASDL